MTQKIRVSLAQIDVKKGNPRVNWERAQVVIAEAHQQKANVVVLPELWDSGYALDKAKELSSNLSGGLFSQVAALAKQYNLFILGSMLEKRGLGVSNSAAIVSPNRGVMGAYRKLHLFPLMDEDRWLTPGEAALTFDMPWGMSAVAICYDLRYPELFRRYAVEGAKIVFVPSQWPHPRLEHFRALLRARAIENQMFVVATNRVGLDEANIDGRGANEYCGHSSIIDPWGNTVIELGEGEGVYTVEIDLSLVDALRRQMPVLDGRRPEHYSF